MAEDTKDHGDNDNAASGSGEDAWDDGGVRIDPDASDALLVDVEGFEGPLDLLLAMARTQKVDLARISILALVEQYLAFIHEAQRIRLELAADYLVMAAWLAYLKSRLLLPREETPGDQLSAEELAQRLSFRLMRLEAMRESAAKLLTRHRLGRDVFARGAPETVKRRREIRYGADMYSLLKAYAIQRQRTVKVVHTVRARKVWSIKDARNRLEGLIGASIGDWVQLDLFLEQYLPIGEDARTVRAASFGATLEMAREGLVDLRQEQAFGPIYMRRREDEDRKTSRNDAHEKTAPNDSEEGASQ